MYKRQENAWKGTLEKVFKTDSGENNGAAAFFAGKNDSVDGEVDENGLFHTNHVYICNHKIAKPRVFIPVFPGTNCEYDSTRAFERAEMCIRDRKKKGSFQEQISGQ